MKPRQSAHDSDRGRSFRRSTANTAGAILCVEIDPELALKRQQIGYLEHIERARVAKPPISVVHVANSSDVYPELVRRGATPDLVTDQTTAHDRVRADGLFVRRGGLRASRTLLARTNVPFEGLPARIAWLELAHVVRTDVALVVNALVAKGDSIAFSATSQRRRNGASTITTERMKDVSDAVGAAVARPGPTTGRSASCAKSIQVTRKRWTRLSNALRLIDNLCFRQLNYGQAVEVRQVRRLPAR